MAAHECAPARPSDITADDEMGDYQLAGDPPTKKKGYYILKIEDGFGVGGCGNRRHGEWHAWTSKTKRSATPEEKAAWKARTLAEKTAREEAQAVTWAQRADEALERWNRATPATEHPYLTAKGITGAPARALPVWEIEYQGKRGPYTERIENALLIPIYIDNKLQAVQTIDPEGEKSYMQGARKQGAYSQLVEHGDDRSVIFIAEGWATAKSVRAAVGAHPVIAALDAGNLAPVAVHFHKKYPASRIILMADNDRFTMVDGKPKNVGRIQAEQAAVRIGGATVLWPEFPDTDTTGKDWNDAHQTLGIEYVKDRIAQALAAPLAADLAPEPVDDPPAAAVSPDGVQRGGSDPIPPPEPRELPRLTINDVEMDAAGFCGLPFKVLGYNGNEYFYFPFAKQQIVSLSAGGHTLGNLFQLANLNQWEAFAGPRASDKDIQKLASNAMITEAHKIGVFQQENKVRGCGVWADAGRHVVHCGDQLIVDNVPCAPRRMSSAYVYVAAARLFLPSKNPLSDAESRVLRTICDMPSWENPLSGKLLAGWLVIAPLCGILEWRPHIWVEGLPGVGKTTVVNKIIRPVLGEIALNVDGRTTESSIRNRLGSDARPVVFDEAEGKGGVVTNMDGVLELARLASSGGVVSKFGQRPQPQRSCFALSSISPPIKDFADETRISRLNLVRDTKQSAQQRYDDLLALIEETITPDFSSRLLSRSVANIKTILENTKTLKRAARAIIKGARAADQISAMLAGAVSLETTRLITEDEAIAMINENSWSDHTAINEDPDPVRLVHHIATGLIRVIRSNGGPMEVSIGELIVAAAVDKGDIDQKYADRVLRQYSIVAKSDGVTIGYKNQNLQRLLRGTNWEVNWGGTLAGYDGATKLKNAYFGAGNSGHAIKLPLKAFYDGAVQRSFDLPPRLPPVEEEISLDD